MTQGKREDVFTRIYDRAVRRFWATAEPITEAEFKQMVEDEGLKYPAAQGRIITPSSPAELMRLTRGGRSI